jgi:hypothetical protein
MALAAAIGAAAQGITGILGGVIGGRKRRREQRAAQAEFNRRKADYEALDTSNLYGNLSNTMEDLTVNTQQADFTARLQQNQMAATMDAMSGAAGGSGIASLAQAMANQASMNAERAGVSIGQQEAQNQILANQMENQLQMAEARGAADARGLEYEKTQNLLGLSGQRLAAANQAREAATQSILGGVGNLVGAAAPGIAGAMEGKGFFEGYGE